MGVNQCTGFCLRFINIYDTWVLIIYHFRAKCRVVGRGGGVAVVTDLIKIHNFAQSFQKYMMHRVLTLPYFRDGVRVVGGLWGGGQCSHQFTGFCPWFPKIYDTWDVNPPPL